MEYIELTSDDKLINWSTQGVLAAEMNFLKKSSGLKVTLEQNGKDSFPFVIVSERDAELAKMQQDKITKKEAIRILEILYHSGE